MSGARAANEPSSPRTGHATHLFNIPASISPALFPRPRIAKFNFLGRVPRDQLPLSRSKKHTHNFRKNEFLRSISQMFILAGARRFVPSFLEISLIPWDRVTLLYVHASSMRMRKRESERGGNIIFFERNFFSHLGLRQFKRYNMWVNEIFVGNDHG